MSGYPSIVLSMVTYVLISHASHDTDAAPVQVTMDTKSPAGDGSVVPCGTDTCDGTYQFCSSGYGRPECLRCTGICADHRVGNDEAAIQRCINICPEFWRRTRLTTTATATAAAADTSTRPQMSSTDDAHKQLVIIISGLVLLLVVIFSVSVSVIFIMWRRLSNRKDPRRDKLPENVDVGTSLSSITEPMTGPTVHYMAQSTSVSDLASAIPSVQVESADSAVQTPPVRITSPADDNMAGLMVTHAGRSLPLVNELNEQFNRRDGEALNDLGDAGGRYGESRWPQRNFTFPRREIPCSPRSPDRDRYMTLEPCEDTHVKTRSPSSHRENIPSGYTSSSGDIALVSDAEVEADNKDQEQRPLMGPDPQRMPSFRSH